MRLKEISEERKVQGEAVMDVTRTEEGKRKEEGYKEKILLLHSILLLVRLRADRELSAILNILEIFLEAKSFLVD